MTLFRSASALYTAGDNITAGCDMNMSWCARSVSLHLHTLRAAGFYRPRAGAGRLRRALHLLYRTYTFFVISTYVLLQCICAYQRRSDLEKLTQVMYVMLCFGTCAIKQVVFNLGANRIDALLASLDEPLMNQEAGAGGALLREAARGATSFLRGFTSCAVATCVLWTVFPLLDRLQGRHVEFPFWIGFSHDHYLVFGAVLLYSFYVTSLVGIGQTAMDAFIATILDQCKTQFRILRMNFESLPERAAAAAAGALTGEQYDAALRRLFADLLLHYKLIIGLSARLDDIFSALLLMQFGISGWIICMAAFELVSLNVLSIEFASTTLFSICIFVELFLFCYYGNEVTVESERVVESIYSMEWSRAPLSLQRSLLVVMERAKRPLRPTAGLVMPLSLGTFVTILKSSYSFYAVLRQTKEAGT